MMGQLPLGMKAQQLDPILREDRANNSPNGQNGQMPVHVGLDANPGRRTTARGYFHALA
jgi:hypothetical protein